MIASPEIVVPRRWSSFRRLVALGGTRTGVLGITTVGNLVVRTGSSMALTRLLTPDDFGIVGIIASVFFAVTMITDLGFQDFLIRHERADERHFRDVIWTIHAKRGIALCLALIIGSPLIAYAFAKPVVAMPLAAASLIFLINGVASLSLIIALRHDKSREIALIDFGLQIFQTVCCLLLALWWRNAWSIIAAMVAQSAARTLLSYRLFPESREHFANDPAVSREFRVFSQFILASSAMALVIGQTDKLVLGRLFTLGEFGLYAIALTIATAPLAFADSYVNRIAFPIYARTWREAPTDLGNTYYRVRRLPASLYAFACGGLMGAASLAVALLYDPRYAAAATFVSLLMVGTALRLPNVAAAQLMIATGHVKKSMHVTIVRLIWVLAAIPAGLFVFGPIGVVAAIGLIEVPALVYCWIQLRNADVFKLHEEALFLALVALGAGIGWLVASEALRLFPHL